MARERFTAAQAAELDEIFGLTSGEEDLRREFEQLALETYDHLASAGRPWPLPFTPYPSASNFAAYDVRPGRALPDDLGRRWRAWEAQYPYLWERQPALELRDALHTISESHDSSSWPTGWEVDIRRWVEGGDGSAIPFDDRAGVATPEFYARLAHLRRAVGGWLYRDPETVRVMFVRDEANRPSLTDDRLSSSA